MFAMMIYVLVIGVLLSIAALIAEHAARQRVSSQRWIWLMTIVASIALPLIISSVTVQVPALIKPVDVPKPIVLREATSVHMPAAMYDLGMLELRAQPHRFDSLFHAIWLGASLLMLVALTLSGCLLYARKRRWAKGKLGHTPVLIASDVGPAVVGLLRPCIVVPAWLLQESATHQQSVLAHEQSHLDARDPQMLTVALCLLIVMPWNLPLWWQLHRLRRAIEVDCDARVLRSGQEMTQYCETLIQVGQNQSSYIGAVAAMAESGSFLEQRIKIMLLKPGKWARLTALAMIVASVGMAAFAAQVTPPGVPNESSVNQVNVSPAVLASYTGSYLLSAPYGAMSVKVDGSHLVTQILGQEPVPIYASSDTEFFATMVKASISFVQSPQGQATALVLHQGGRDTTAPRIDAVKAQEIAVALDARVKAQQPFPGSEQAFQIVLNHDPNSPRIGPALAQVMRQQMARYQEHQKQLGPTTSHEFTGVTPQGWDKYLVRHENGSEEVWFVMDSNGIIVGSVHRE
ncbi:M56 family metallopeptidase [Rhodanobacter sp. A1T4]|uniref:M56 family metallopeptidase n=1 Tax=Rhodanobacter sp. A1T4 TaxID=2723087 RepID=UPI0016182340|nr:M56 family metallopeptidase [Rhodanobacter sp. A1T4]MBB6245671.1 beta-lactamase regulating signal transducer with metallopeptidase domain [Rhodanobacter sp. A1T4]